MRFTTNDRRGRVTFEVETPEQAVGMLWKAAFLRECSPDRYMVEVAKRVRQYNRIVVRTDCAENFLADIETAGLITIEEETR